MRKLSLRARTWTSEVCYALLVLVTVCFFALSCVALLSQAVRTSHNGSWENNWDAVIIGATYFLVVRFGSDMYIPSLIMNSEVHLFCCFLCETQNCSTSQTAEDFEDAPFNHSE